MLLHGKQQKPWEFRKVNFTLLGLSELMTGMGLKILSTRVNTYLEPDPHEQPNPLNFHMYVKAQRP
jgi:hypothetical protein